MVDIRVKWDTELAKALLSRAQRGATDIMAQVMVAEAQLMLRDSTRIAPWLTRTLIKSATIKPPKVIGNRVTLKFGYGGAARKYAEIQHEKYPVKRKPGRRWHYLKDPVMARAGKMDRHLERRLNNLLKGKL